MDEKKKHELMDAIETIAESTGGAINEIIEGLTGVVFDEEEAYCLKDSFRAYLKS